MASRPDTALSELVVLSVLAEEALYGYAIAKRVAARSDDRLRLTAGVLYPLLKKLEKGGLVMATWETVRSERAEEGSEGRRRKWYRLSAKGRRRLAQHAQAQREHQRLVQAFLPPEDAEATA
ncbi:MAG: helix-turn-helix transcriptional regulator [Phycisphaerales bacterium]|nr:helix-turn-helix transcriptional regulator [Phycisphaerales bacterium]